MAVKRRGYLRILVVAYAGFRGKRIQGEVKARGTDDGNHRTFGNASFVLA